jgi:hypothetical protein
MSHVARLPSGFAPRGRRFRAWRSMGPLRVRRRRFGRVARVATDPFFQFGQPVLERRYAFEQRLHQHFHRRRGSRPIFGRNAWRKRVFTHATSIIWFQSNDYRQTEELTRLTRYQLNAYREFFCRIHEEAFAVLYSDQPSRPAPVRVAVNVLVGLEALKAGFGWSDAELYENSCFNLQVRYALGYDRLGDGDFEIRTLYYFRERLSRHNLKAGVNLLEQAFEQMTDAQIIDLKVRTGMQRMDSTHIASNIVSASRLQLLVEALQRVERILNEADTARLAETFAPYLKDSAGHYTYRVKGPQAVREHLQKIGQTLQALLVELKSGYAAENAYQVLERIFTDNYHRLASGPQAKENKELTSDCLQSVDDLEATYRTKGTGHYQGYVANLTETCDPENELQLITQVQVAPNNVDDSQLLAEALPNLTERTDLDTLVTDGGFGGEASDSALQEHGVTLIQTALRGASPDPNKFSLADFGIQQDEQGHPTTLTCP